MAVNLDKYRRELEEELETGKKSTQPQIAYSEVYKQFKKEQVGTTHSIYEAFCNFSGVFLKVKIKPEDREKIQNYIDRSHLDITTDGSQAFGYVVFIIGLLVSIVIGFLTLNLYLIAGGIITSLILLYFTQQMPKQIFTVWRSKASNQLVTAVLYIIIYMEQTSNLELSVNFAAKHLPPPLSLDLMKILWDIEVGKHSNITDSLNAYLKHWEDYEPHFVESVQLIESALQVKTEASQREMLDRAISTILAGVESSMLGFAHNLKSPMETVHMLGVVLPIMGLVMLPMVGAFMGETVKWYYLFIFYDLALPLIVFLLGRNILQTRPGSASQGSITEYTAFNDSKRITKIGKTIIPIPPWLIAVFVFLGFCIPPTVYFYQIAVTFTGLALREALTSVTSMLFSALYIAGGGVAVATYYYLVVFGVIKQKKETEKIEADFGTAIFQLGNQIDQDIPVETAFGKVAEQVKNTTIYNFFKIIDDNIRQKGASLEDAIFSKEYGALTFYPSSLIASVMRLLVEGSKKGTKVTAKSLITISKYVDSARRVDERLKDLLAETLSSMQMQTKFFVPVITGIVVGLAVMTVSVLLKLGIGIQNLSMAGAGSAEFGVGENLLSIFQLDSMMPGVAFQIIVGVYCVEIILLLSFLISGLIYGSDEIEFYNIASKNLYIGTIEYVIISSIVTVLFVQLIGGVLTVL